MNRLETETISIEVTHIGEDYGKVEVIYSNGTNHEYEVALGLAEALAIAFGDKE